MTHPVSILNTSIITNFGSFTYEPLTLDAAKDLVQSEFISAVGHESTAQILTSLLEVEIPVNRIQFSQEVSQKAIVFKLKGRPPEGKILSKEELEAIGYDFGLLTRTA